MSVNLSWVYIFGAENSLCGGRVFGLLVGGVLYKKLRTGVIFLVEKKLTNQFELPGSHFVDS
ncbi:hypothetical protein [Pseudomonas chlororaphis]|uniref:hypothetical protein n=1 Tax=Pseudomonas chlororaphis TaxID=587753 RepID=UPI000F57EA29|nr:hypothetical protein [Pseudomonas chlororaphis]WDG70392.1 hypothetical protein PUP65_19975 [Pseudomonas chlororaphis]WDH31821.1 hypothetical protein PUP81_14345 [Pseudomonas chlororaphis]WDH68918.1 hypothetical protein PUP78_19960 [Pseudomonas chlororaphis]